MSARPVARRYFAIRIVNLSYEEAGRRCGAAVTSLSDGLLEGTGAGQDEHDGDRDERRHVGPQVHERGPADDDPARDRDEVRGGHELRGELQSWGERADREHASRQE